MVFDNETESRKSANMSTKSIEVGNKWALLIGINDYLDSMISKLNFSAKDIEEFYEILVDSQKGKYNINNVEVLSDLREQKPTRNIILSKLAKISRSASPEDSVLFYFSGHGYEKEGNPYLLCSDSYTNTLEETAIPTETIRKTMEDSLARTKIIVIDACHSGAIKGRKDSGIMTKTFFETFFPAPEGFAVLASCKLGEYSYEWKEKEHGVFSYYLLEGMNGLADRDGDGIITITDAHRYTSENVKRWAFKTGVEQNPTLEAKISGDIPLVFVETIPGKMEEGLLPSIDKSAIIQISLQISPQDTRTKRDYLLEKLCGSLLQFIEASEIVKESEREYEFSYGKIIANSATGLYWIDVKFYYAKRENWEKIDAMIKYLDNRYFWSSIEYLLNSSFNVEKLVQKCKENAFEITGFKPEKKLEVIRVNTGAWLGTNTVFSNNAKSKYSTICISAPEDSFLLPGFYSTLSPENIIEFIKNCL